MTVNRRSEATPRATSVAAKLLVGAALVAFATTGGYFIHQQQAHARETNASTPVTEAKRASVVVAAATVRHLERAILV